MNLLRQQAVRQIKTLFRSIPEIRRINDDQTNFDEKLYALTRIESVRHKESAVPLGRFIVSLPQCQAASLIDGDLEFNKNTNIQAMPMEQTDQQAILDKDGGLRVPVNLSTFVTTAFDDLVKISRSSSYYDQKRYRWYFDDWKKIPKWTEITDKSLIERQNKKLVVEFSSPNIAKPLHAGHLRSTLLGQFIATIHERFGHSVYRLNYLGDWGTQYGRLAVGFSKFGSYEELNKRPLMHLLDIYIRANKDESLHEDAMQYFVKMEANDEEALDLWKKFRELTIDNLKQIYQLFDIRFDEYQSESQFSKQSKEIIEKLCQLGYCKKRSNGVLEANIPAKYNSLPRDACFIVQKSDGTSLYITRDIAALKSRLETLPIEQILYVVDSSQTEHFRNLLTISKALQFDQVQNWDLDDFYVPFGRMINLQTRRGKFDLLSDVFHDAKERAKEGLDRFLIRKEGIDHGKVSEVIGKAYLILNDFSRPRRTDYVFSWHEISSKDGIAFLLLYCHARLCSLEKQVKMPIDWSANVNLLTDRQEHMLIQQLSTFQDVLFDAYRSHEPNKVVHYLVRLV
ncbi:unnamed protein product [Rotaria sp. Silwood1]|nr:unnamed protein product [Rotaria sp. Silwood1]CAF0966967.1 unnamed protein product [Rotaria sp. Silwood1]CAF3392221.1 unnamed protein product [Rotaria sp. Silwood1]CAF3414515.1 unnamed protein product [Rotaria sp. Silwood1]CAF4634850.1 unnamed protein product [Rotaria sp. Silwood1]